MPKYSNTQLDSLFTALADPTRRQVVEQLSSGPATVSELAAPFSMSLPSFVQHLGVLEKAGIISSTKEGRVRTCRLEKNAVDALEQWVTQAQRYWEDRLDALTQYAESMHQASLGTDADTATDTEKRK